MAGFKKVLVVITFSLLETRTKFSEWPQGIYMAALINFTDLTPGKYQYESKV